MVNPAWAYFANHPDNITCTCILRLLAELTCTCLLGWYLLLYRQLKGRNPMAAITPAALVEPTTCQY